MNFREYITEAKITPKLVKKIADLTGINNHTEARMLISKDVIYDTELYNAFKQIQTDAEKDGHLSMENSKKRLDLERKMQKKMEKKLSKDDFNKTWNAL